MSDRGGNSAANIICTRGRRPRDLCVHGRDLDGPCLDCDADEEPTEPYAMPRLLSGMAMPLKSSE